MLDDLAWLGLDWDEGPDRGGPFAPVSPERARARATTRRSNGCSPTGARFPAPARAPTSRAPPRRRTTRTRTGPAIRAPAAACRPTRSAPARRAQGRAPAIRFAGDGARIDFVDEVHGAVAADAAGIDDFVLRRADGTAAYQLAVVVDDAAMAITRVVRGDDLLRSTPRQLALYRALGLPAPAFAHVPLVLTAVGRAARQADAPGGRRRPARAAASPPEVVVGALAASAGLSRAGRAAMPADAGRRVLPGGGRRRAAIVSGL